MVIDQFINLGSALKCFVGDKEPFIKMFCLEGESCVKFVNGTYFFNVESTLYIDAESTLDINVDITIDINVDIPLDIDVDITLDIDVDITLDIDADINLDINVDITVDNKVIMSNVGTRGCSLPPAGRGRVGLLPCRHYAGDFSCYCTTEL